MFILREEREVFFPKLFLHLVLFVCFFFLFVFFFVILDRFLCTLFIAHTQSSQSKGGRASRTRNEHDRKWVFLRRMG